MPTRQRHANTAAAPPMPLDPQVWPVVVATLKLAPQHVRVVELVMLGKRDKQIASELGLGVPTVRTYLSRVFLRAGVQDRVELILRIFSLAEEIRNSHVARGA